MQHMSPGHDLHPGNKSSSDVCTICRPKEGDISCSHWSYFARLDYQYMQRVGGWGACLCVCVYVCVCVCVCVCLCVCVCVCVLFFKQKAKCSMSTESDLHLPSGDF